MVTAVLDALASLPGSLLLAVVGAAALLETLGVPVAIVVASRRRRRGVALAAAAA